MAASVLDLDGIIIGLVVLVILYRLLGPPILPYTRRWRARRERRQRLAEEREQRAARRADLKRRVLDRPRLSVRRALRRGGGSDADDAGRDGAAGAG